MSAGERVSLPSVVLYEWLRGPRSIDELEAQELLFPSVEALAFGAEEARRAAELYQGVGRPRGREIDLAIAATALCNDAQLWTLNRRDFTDLSEPPIHTGYASAETGVQVRGSQQIPKGSFDDAIGQRVVIELVELAVGLGARQELSVESF